jgi:hypothetical protein
MSSILEKYFFPIELVGQQRLRYVVNRLKEGVGKVRGRFIDSRIARPGVGEGVV